MTIWLTRIRLNLRDKAVHRDLHNIVGLHQRLMRMMPTELGPTPRAESGLLYRIDETRTGTHLLVQSRHYPEFSELPPTYGDTATRELTPLLDRLVTGNTISYRLAANTSKRLGRTSERAGKLVALRGEDAQTWWQQRAQRCGLDLHTVSLLDLPDARGKRIASTPGDRIRHAVTRFDGIATITDSHALRNAVTGGIGRGRAHGCGLLSLAVVR
ncbi:type I-E CRISPR-associated protein Cas6/Cse3/CasE [Nocardia sp. CNY236]|uniref:type I-E CRISPR-associated protein Cas6/Cse3/CasE n=1 Tax=Nocardia sp. CNY236 TaxID=1169152 RepID=UPI0003FFAB88|nr:type I-E CRISPR-associated protein Cas6/Cse3/CasE [Nocardia sp. CNY236]